MQTVALKSGNSLPALGLGTWAMGERAFEEGSGLLGTGGFEFEDGESGGGAGEKFASVHDHTL